MHIKKIFMGLLFLLGGQIAAFASPAEDISRLLFSFKTLTAHFNQVTYDANKRPMQNTTGTMALSRPGKFRWEIAAPNAQLLVADTRYLWIYDIDLSQATRQAMDRSKISSPASLLSGSPAELMARFQVVELAKDPTPSFRLTPKNAGDLFKQIEISFAAGKLTRMKLFDNLGSLSVFQFSQVTLDPPLAPSVFQFKAPKGVDVIEN